MTDKVVVVGEQPDVMDIEDASIITGIAVNQIRISLTAGTNAAFAVAAAVVVNDMAKVPQNRRKMLATIGRRMEDYGEKPASFETWRRIGLELVSSYRDVIMSSLTALKTIDENGLEVRPTAVQLYQAVVDGFTAKGFTSYTKLRAETIGGVASTPEEKALAAIRNIGSAIGKVLDVKALQQFRDLIDLRLAALELSGGKENDIIMAECRKKVDAIKAMYGADRDALAAPIVDHGNVVQLKTGTNG